jgi:glucose-1-phosphate cytidylyltransferase
MKAVILAGGLGTRISEETSTRPKPMIEIGGKPILWHIMKIYAAHGVRDFIICLGYKGYLIKEFFVNFHHHTSDLTVDTGTGEVSIHRRGEDAWRVTLVETGLETMTGGRLKRIREYVAGEDAFFMTYGDGVASIDITALLAFHRAQGKLATVTAVRPPGRLIWLHAASVGETLSLLPVLDELAARAPALQVLLTTGTVTSARP